MADSQKSGKKFKIHSPTAMDDAVAKAKAVRGRGAAFNPVNRFEELHVARDPDCTEEDPKTGTQFFLDNTKSFITYNDSPDVGFSAGINPYRGCEHGCVYCFARPNHEYLGLSSGLDFESKIFVKKNAAELLRKELSARNWKPQVVAMCGNTDCYQPAERKFRLTRACLEVFAEFRNPVVIITKNKLVSRDVDLLAELARYNAVRVCVSVTTLDYDLAGKMEPRASRPKDRLSAIEILSKHNVPVTVMNAPIVPGLTDHETPAILKAAAQAGAKSAGYTIVRLPWAVKNLFEQWLTDHFPDRKEKVLNRLRDMRHGKLYDATWGKRTGGDGPFADQIDNLFNIACKKVGLNEERVSLSTAHFRKPAGSQMMLFE